MAGYYAQSTMKKVDWSTSPQSFCERNLFACAGFLAWGTDFQSATHLGVYWVALGKYRLMIPSLVSPSALLQLSGIWKRAYALIWNPDFCDCCTGDSSRSPGSGSHQGYTSSSTGRVHLHTLKSAAWGFGFQAPWMSVSAKWDLLWDTNRSWPICNYWELLKNIIGCLDNHKA